MNIRAEIRSADTGPPGSPGLAPREPLKLLGFRRLRRAGGFTWDHAAPCKKCIIFHRCNPRSLPRALTTLQGVAVRCRILALFSGLAVGHACGAAGFGVPSGAVFYYAGRPVTVRKLTLVPSARAHALLRTIAASIKRPVGGLWKRELGVGWAAPAGYYTPPRGASRLDVVVHLWRATIENVALSYLSAEVAKALLVKQPCNLSRYYHLRRLHRYLLDTAQPLQASSELHARYAAKRWDLRAFASALRRERPVGDWAADVIPLIRREPASYMIAAWCFPLCKGRRVAVSWSAPQRVMMTLPAMLKAVRAMRPQLIRIVAREYGETPFVEVRATAGALRAATAAARALVASAVHPNRRPRKLQMALALIGSPTVFDAGTGGNGILLRALTGLPTNQLTPGKLIPMKRQPGRYLYIPTAMPPIAHGYLGVRPPSFLFDAGVRATLDPLCRAVLAQCRPAVHWFKKPSLAQLRRASWPSVGLPETRSGGTKLPELLRRPYRNYRWQTSTPMPRGGQ